MIKVHVLIETSIEDQWQNQTLVHIALILTIDQKENHIQVFCWLYHATRHWCEKKWFTIWIKPLTTKNTKNLNPFTLLLPFKPEHHCQTPYNMHWSFYSTFFWADIPCLKYLLFFIKILAALVLKLTNYWGWKVKWAFKLLEHITNWTDIMETKISLMEIPT